MCQRSCIWKQALWLWNLLGRGLFSCPLTWALTERLWEQRLVSSWNQLSPAQFCGMLPCLVISCSAMAAALPRAITSRAAVCPFVSAQEKETTGCSSVAWEMNSMSTEVWSLKDDVCDGVSERDELEKPFQWLYSAYIKAGSRFNSRCQSWDKTWSRCTPRAC